MRNESTVPFFLLVFLILASIVGGMWGYPAYTVYSARKAGEAQFAQAQSNRNIKVLEAKALAEAAKALADADVNRAHGVAEANAIIGRSLKDNEEYLKWLYIEAIKDGKNDVIYVPTEASMPLMLGGKR